MANKIYIDWQDDNFTWDSEIREWENVYIIIEQLVGGGARDPQYWGDYPYIKDENQTNINELRHQLEQNLNRLNDKSKKKLIEVLVTLDGEKYKEHKTSNNDIKITVEDVEYIAENLAVNIKILDIK